MGNSAQATLTWGVRFDPDSLPDDEREAFEEDPDDWLVGKLIGLPARPEGDDYDDPKWVGHWAERRKAKEECKFKLHWGGDGDEPYYVLGYKERTTETDWDQPQEVGDRGSYVEAPLDLSVALAKLRLNKGQGRWYLLAYWG